MSDLEKSLEDETNQVISDFGAQWVKYTDNAGYYASSQLLQDIFGTLLSLNEIKGARTLDVGSGSGRIVNMLLDVGTAHVVAVEPSMAFSVLKENTRGREEQIQYINLRGDQLPDMKLDFAFSIGVLHHIPDPIPVVRRVYDCLKLGGKFLFWVYGKEGNELYLFFVLPLRKITQRLPDSILSILAHILNIGVSIYAFFCLFIPLPLHKYMRNVYIKLDWKTRFLAIFDQLNPAYSKYYTQDEAVALMKSGGFQNIKIERRQNYSWTVIGEKL
ncbi:MAG: class I SAM-dependent methyltransferase [Anaerolineales bacterium]|nr:class I SAM-dependent methyltransferase [Anaerolineales bacterium]